VNVSYSCDLASQMLEFSMERRRQISPEATPPDFARLSTELKPTLSIVEESGRADR
jgi:hypothetical protein